MTPANQAMFDDPRSNAKLRLYAMGLNPVTGKFRGGIGQPKEDKVRPGETLYRIGHSNKPMTINMTSPWWMRDASLHHMMGAAHAADSDPQELYRMKCAVSYDFGVADIILQARVKMTLRAFTGRGRPVIDDDEERKGQVWLGSYEIAQLFIPGLRDFATGFPTQLFRDSIEIVEKFKVSEFIRIQRQRTRTTRRQLQRA